MKKLILAILFAAFFALGSALALPCVSEFCAPFCTDVPMDPLHPGYWHDQGAGVPSATSCCTTSACTLLCANYNPAAAAAVTAASVTTDAPIDQSFKFTITIGSAGVSIDDWTLKVKIPWNNDGNCPDVTVTNGGTIIHNSVADPDDPTGCISTGIATSVNRYGAGTLAQGGSENLEFSIPAAGSTQGTHTILVESSQSGTSVNANTLPVGVSYIFPSGLNPTYKIYQLIGGVPTAITSNWIPNNTVMYIGSSTPGSEMAFKVDPSAFAAGATTWSLTTFAIDEDSTGAGTTIAEDHINLFPAATKLLLMEAGNVPYGICCPIANIKSEVAYNCQQMFVTYNTLTINSVKYFTCTGTGTGGTTQGDTNLTINDSAEGSSVVTGVSVDFYAYFYNKTNGIGDTTLNSTNSNCTVNEDGANQTMTYSSGNKRWEATDASGYATSGTKSWDVWCDTNATGHVGLWINDSILITDPAAPSYPEFSDFAWVLAAVLGAGGFVLMRRKMNSSF